MSATFISLVALVISLASFSLALFQFRHNRKINKLAKINEIINSVFDLKRLSAELKHLIDISDDVESHDEIFKRLHLFTESASSILNSPKIKDADLYHIEQALLKNQLEFDLFAMQINEQIRFNKECRNFDNAQQAS